MFSARKKGGKKEVPQWKRDLEGQEDNAPPSKRPAANDSVAEASRDLEVVAVPAPSSSSGATSSASADISRGAPSSPPPDDDDDDDDNFDPSNYDLDAGQEEEDEKPPWASEAAGDAAPVVPSHPAAEPIRFLPGGRFNDIDGQDTICFHSKGASNEACQNLVGTLPGYKATRFVRSLVFVLFADGVYAASAMERLNKSTLIDEAGKPMPIRTEWAKRSLRPF